MIEQEIIGFHLADVISLLWRRKLLILGAGITGVAVAVAILACGWSIFASDGQVVVRAEASVAPDQDRAFYSTAVNDAVVTTERNVLIAQGLLSRVAESVNFPPGYIEPNRLRSGFNELLDRFGFSVAQDADEASRLEAAARVAVISSAITTSVDKGSSVITIRAMTTDPRFSADIVNRILKLYMDDRLAAQRRSALNVEHALRERLEQTRGEIASVQQKVSALMRPPDLVESTDINNSATQKVPAGGRPAGAQAILAAHILDLDKEKEALANLHKITGTIEDRLIAVVAQPADTNARILSWAQVPIRPAYPNKPIVCTIGLLIGIAISSALIILREHVQRGRRSAASQTNLLAGRLLGSLPELTRKMTNAASLAVSFQGIAFEVEDACKRGGFGVITITSCVPNEGKTTVATNLALTLRQSGKRVLLINGDLHRPTNGRGSRHGLADVDNCSEETAPEFFVSSTTGLHVLSLCDRPPKDPVSFLRSPRFSGIVERARKEYDFVLCDTPPVFSVPDALVVAQTSDAILLVSEYRNGMNRDMNEEILRRLSSTGRPVCGVILTKVTSRDMGYSSYAGYNRRRGSRSILGALAAMLGDMPSKIVLDATARKDV